jgi:hypothetical protein
MNYRVTILGAVFCFLMFACLCADYSIAAGKAQEFSAVMVTNDSGSESKTLVHFSQDKQRLEPAQKGKEEGQAVIIMRLDKEIAWTLLPSTKTYLEITAAGQKENPLFGEEGVVKREKMGKEIIEGHPTLKEKDHIVYKDGTKEKVLVWKATDLDLPIKAAAVDGSWSYLLTDIKVGKQDPELFEVPKGYKRVGLQPSSSSGLPDGGDSDEGLDGALEFQPDDIPEDQ